MVWQIPEELRKELAGLGSVRPYASMRYMSKGAYRTQATYKAHAIANTDLRENSPTNISRPEVALSGCYSLFEAVLT